MLKLYNKEHKAIGVLTNLKDYKIEYVLSGEDLLEFSLSICDENIHLVEEEGYVRNKNNEYVIKAIDPTDSFKRFTCNVNVEDIVGKAIANFDTSNNTITDTIRLAIAGTGWILADNNITKRRTIRLKNTNALEVLREVRKVFRVDFRFDAINKKIYVYEKFGSDKGVYFSDELNLKSFSIPSDTYDYAARIYPYGKDELNISIINGGKEYIDNFQYSSKIIETIWEDNRYTDVNSLKEDAEAKLDELSKPKRSYQADIVDLAKQSAEYKFLDFFLGDTITLLSKQEKFRDKQRIVKYIEYPKSPTQNTCELGNTTLTFEDLQKENEAKNSTVDNITSDNGTVDGSKVDDIKSKQISDLEVEVAKITNLTVINADITNLKAQNVTITGKLNAIEGEFGTLKANVGVIDKLTVTHSALINDLQANKADITDFTATNIKFDVASGKTLDLQTLLSKFVTGENGQFINISSSNSVIANATIKNAMIESLSVDKLLAGRISTNKFTVTSDDGGIEIVGATQQFKDKNNKVRIQMGQDTQGNFNFILRGEDGITTLIDHTGIKEKAIADDLIKENMVAADAIGEKQINYSSLITGLNKDDNTSLIKASKVAIDLTGQSLEVSFNRLKSNVDGLDNKIESNTTAITVAQGKIEGLISENSIIKGDVTTISDKYTSLKATVDGISTTVASNTSSIGTINTNISGLSGKVATVENKYASLSQDLSGFKTTVGNTYSTKSELSNLSDTVSSINSRVSTAESSITQLNNKIALKVESTDITEAINNIQIGVRNIVKDTGTPKSIVSTGATNITGARYNLTVPYLTDIKDKELIVVFDWKYEGENPSGTFYMQTGEPQYGPVTSREPISPTNTSGSIKKIWKPTMEKDTKIVYMRTDNMVGTLTISNLRIYFGTMDIGWTPAPEDIQEQIDANKTEISTTKSNMATIETNLSSITSRVSTVENKQTTVDGKVTALETWKKSAEVKITDSAIVSTVTKSTAYKNDLNGKVSYNNIISSINQTSETIKIDASKINLNGYVTMTNLNTPGQTVIDGENIKTNTILAEKIAIGDFTNYVVIPTNSTFTGTSGSTEGYEVCSIKGSEKYNHANISNKLYGINGGDKFRVKAMIKSDTVGSRLDITCCWRNANNEIVSSSTIYGTVSSANTWTEINEIITVPSRPSGASYVRFKINIQAEQYRRIYVERLNITRMYSGELIVDGSITSIKLSADAIDGRTIKGAIIVGGELRGSSNFFTSPDPNSVDGYAFRIYSTGELHSNNLILTSIGNNYSRLESSGVISCSKQVNSPAIITGGQSLWLGIRGVTPGSESNFNFELTQQADKTVYFRPGYNGQAVLGHSAKMFNKVYSVNGVSSSSDRTLKENIKYLSTTANPNCRLATDITELDLYNFVKDDLVTAKFNFIGDDKQHIGFIAQDLLYNADGTDNRIGQIIVNKPDDERSPLSYNEKIYVNVLAGALRHAILKIEEKNDKIINLEKRLEELENKMIV